MVWTLQHKQDPAGDIVKWKAQLCTGATINFTVIPIGRALHQLSHGQLFIASSFWYSCWDGTCAPLIS